MNPLRYFKFDASPPNIDAITSKMSDLTQLSIESEFKSVKDSEHEFMLRLGIKLGGSGKLDYFAIKGVEIPYNLNIFYVEENQILINLRRPLNPPYFVSILVRTLIELGGVSLPKLELSESAQYAYRDAVKLDSFIA
ncbi:MAG: hypothetical protein AAFW00_28595 [Bacteroidota bacterium]